MTAMEILDELQHRARQNKELKDKFINTRNAQNPLQEFCRISREEGLELYPMEVICAGEEFHAAMKRSSNGGGENSPKLKEQDHFYELFLAGL